MLEKVSVLVMSSGNPDLLGDLELLWKMVVVVWMHVAGILYNGYRKVETR